ncbi:MAG: NAD(P)/FAD-dependent oxidoreductase [Alphaproteobacteria bacterium]|nr:NAD(P)/FAD-dependent oxidoreductase [Alphaproteobacteria bacterium]
MPASYDAIVIGGGHNGLTAAAYLGKSGLRTLVLERRHVIGGAAVTEEFHPGYRNSLASYTVSLLRPEVIADLELKRHGLSFVPYRGALELLGDGTTVLLTGDEERDQAAIARFSNRDWDRLKRLRARLARVGELARDQILRPPPDLAGGWGAAWSALRIAGKARSLDVEDRLFLTQLFTLSADELMGRWFESETMRQIMAVHCVSSNYASMRQPGSAIPYFLNVLGELDGRRGKWGVARGGMGAITQAMAAAGRAHGVEIRTDAPVARVVVEGGRAIGVVLESGESFAARAVLANTDPKRTFLKLVGREHLDAEFADHIERLRMGHASLRMNLALSGTPRFAGLSAADNAIGLGCAITMLPSRRDMEQTWRTAQDGGIPDAPYVNIQVASALDDSLAPPGHHVMSLLCKYYPYQLADGLQWDAIKERVADSILAAVARHVPNLPAITVARQVLSPLDLERILGLTEGDIFHGRHDLDQILSLRPHPRAAGYATPVPGLYLCGSGSHPGGGVSGAPGHNAARRVIKDLRRR